MTTLHVDQRVCLISWLITSDNFVITCASCWKVITIVITFQHETHVIKCLSKKWMSVFRPKYKHVSLLNGNETGFRKYKLTDMLIHCTCSSKECVSVVVTWNSDLENLMDKNIFKHFLRIYQNNSALRLAMSFWVISQNLFVRYY